MNEITPPTCQACMPSFQAGAKGPEVSACHAMQAGTNGEERQRERERRKEVSLRFLPPPSVPLLLQRCSLSHVSCVSHKCMSHKNAFSCHVMPCACMHVKMEGKTGWGRQLFFHFVCACVHGRQCHVHI